MKKLGLLVIFLLLSVSAYAAFLPTGDVTFMFKKALCGPDGVMYLNVTHGGRSVKFSNLSLVAESESFTQQPLIGEWYRGKAPASKYEGIEANYTGNDFAGTSLLTFKTAGLYAKGKYVIKLSWPSITQYNDHILFAVECPGITCTTNNQCLSEQQCTDNVCQWTQCSGDQVPRGHICVSICEDFDKCTTDYFIDGKCSYVRKPGCCTKDSDCVQGNVCKDGNCASTETNIFLIFWNWLKSIYQ